MSTGTHLHTKVDHGDGLNTLYAHHTQTIDRDAVMAAVDSILEPYGMNSNWVFRITLTPSAVRVKHVVPAPGTERDEYPRGINARLADDEFAEPMAETVFVFKDEVESTGGESK